MSRGERSGPADPFLAALPGTDPRRIRRVRYDPRDISRVEAAERGAGASPPHIGGREVGLPRLSRSGEERPRRPLHSERRLSGRGHAGPGGRP